MSEQLSIKFDDRFLERHAGAIVSDPLVAIVELVANAWDAGARQVKIIWPSEKNRFQITDDGTGMTPEEFETRWPTIDYNRQVAQGSKVTFPPGVDMPVRHAYGRNGRGRHAALYFGKSYTVTTVKDGIKSRWRVGRGKSTPLVLDQALHYSRTMKFT